MSSEQKSLRKLVMLFIAEFFVSLPCSRDQSTLLETCHGNEQTLDATRKIELCTDKTDFRFYFVAPFPPSLPLLFQAATSSLLALSHVYKGGFLLACIINKSNAAFFYFQKVFHSPRLQLLNTVRGTTEQTRTLTHSGICMTHTHTNTPTHIRTH